MINRLLLSLSALSLAACQQVVTPTGPDSTDIKTYMYAHALWADPVFARDVTSFHKSFSAQFGTPEQATLFGYSSSKLNEPSPIAVEAAINTFSDNAVDGEDVIVVMFTTHGSPDVLAVKPDGVDTPAGLSADALATFLEPLNNDFQIIVLQACYSGSLIDELAHPNRIILTAAAKDRTSFGCEPNAKNTWFIEALNTSMRSGGPWKTIFDRTKTIVRTQETKQGIPSDQHSNPQSYVGANMREFWTGMS